MKRGSKIDEIVTLVFMLLAIATVVCLFLTSVDRSTDLAIGGVAVVVRIIQYILRFFN